jgi:hypothetical protein
MTLITDIDLAQRATHSKITVHKGSTENILRTMPKQRDFRINSCLELKTAIEQGTFRYLPGQAIHFDNEGHLRNGQHRLLALSMADGGESEPFIEVDVISGATEDEIETLDQGVPRNTADVLAMELAKRGIIIDDHRVITATGRCMMLFDTLMTNDSNTATRIGIEAAIAGKGSAGVTKDQELNYIREHLNELIPAAKYANRGRGDRKDEEASKVPLAPRIAGMVYVLLARTTDQTKALAFLESLATGEKLEKGSPVLVLRNRLKDNPPKPRETALLTLKAWNQFCEGKVVGQTKLAAEETVEITNMPQTPATNIQIVYSSSKTKKALREKLNSQIAVSA